MADYLPAKFLQPTSDLIAANWRRDTLIRNPAADVGPGSLAMLDSLNAGTMAMPIYAYAGSVAANATWLTATGDALRAIAQSMGTDLRPPVGAVGFVQLSASSGGGFLQTGDQLSINGIIYAATVGGFYNDDALVAVYGVTTGPQTDQPAGTVLTWSTPRPGINPQATVFLQPDGTGLSGGANEETEGELKQRISQLKANPIGSGNDAMIQAIVLNTPGLAVQQCFTYPGIKGPGTTGVTFTLRPAQSGGNRIPNSAQLALALGYLMQQLPASDSIFMCALTSSALSLIFEVTWDVSAPGWEDPVPFPPYVAPGDNWMVTNVVTPTPTTFHIKSLTDTTVPLAGQSIGFLNLAEQEFACKRILSATSVSGGYTIVVDTTNGSSDTVYTPLVGQVVSPWSDSLDSLIPPVLAYLDSVGPGEQIPSANIFDPGQRQRRSPPSPSQWSSVISNRMLGGPPNASQPPDPNAAPTPTIFGTPNVDDAELLEPTPGTQTPVGSAGVSSYLYVLASIAAYPET